MIIEIIATGYLVGRYLWSKPWENHDFDKAAKDIGRPTTKEGDGIPIYYGQCRVNNPVLVWTGTPGKFIDGDGDGDDRPNFVAYTCALYYVVGSGYDLPIAAHRLIGIWYGDKGLFSWKQVPSTGTYSGDHFITPNQFSEMSGKSSTIPNSWNQSTWIGASDNLNSQAPHKIEDYAEFSSTVEFLDGSDDQLLVDVVGAGAGWNGGNGRWYTMTGLHMLTYGPLDASQIPGYRGVQSVLLGGNPLYGDIGESIAHNAIYGGAYLGAQPQIKNVNFEMRSWALPSASGVGTYEPIDLDSNPAWIIYDLMTGGRGRARYPSDKIDLNSFKSAAKTLYDEKLGFSRSYVDTKVGDALAEILTYISGALDENPVTGLLRLKLVRPDYGPIVGPTSTVMNINLDNLISYSNVSLSTFADVYNRIEIVFPSRRKGYEEESVIVENYTSLLSAQSQRLLQIRAPGCTTHDGAWAYGRRQLLSRSRPFYRMTAKVDRTFARLMSGDAVTVTIDKLRLDRTVFRVVNAKRGTIEDDSVTLDIVQDYYPIKSQVQGPMSDTHGPIGELPVLAH